LLPSYGTKTFDAGKKTYLQLFELAEFLKATQFSNTDR